jgi:hypothetical protein
MQAMQNWSSDGFWGAPIRLISTQQREMMKFTPLRWR